MLGRSSLRRLKSETAALHARAEQYVRILDADATAADYHRYLVAMHGYHAPLERGLAAHEGLAAAGFEAPLRQKRALLEQDLAQLSAGRGQCAHDCPRLPALGSLARATGVAYVLEGSTLGGRYVLAKLPPALAALRGRATAFLEGYGDATGARWRAFGDVVARAIGSPADEDEAAEGACEAFARLIDWLALHERPLPRPDVVTARAELAARRGAP
ncbi:MAG TPA: biliverdin-producing heme oxygenase [Kofleriaceae bacterium]|nr:biliverdin-producing heme oxygenase [Kofleriaceae bacterium]